MKYLAGFLTGIATAWAALAIWRRIPPFPDLDHEYTDSTDGGIHHRNCRWPERPCLCDLLPSDPGPRSYA